MSRNLRDTGQRSMGDFVSRAAHGNRVEIIDDEDDDIEEINTQGLTEPASTSSRLSRLRTRRQRREDEQEQLFPGDEQNEDLQLQQVLMMSKLEADRQEERRKMCGNVHDVMNLQVEIEPLNSSRATATARKPTGNERDQRDGAESPDLFSTPPEDQEQMSNLMASKNVDSGTEFPDSPPLPVTVRSPTVDLNEESGKTASPQQAASAEPSLRQDKGDTRRKLKLRRTRRGESDLTNHKEKYLEDEPERTECEIQEQETLTANSKIEECVTASGEKRKFAEDIADFTDEEEPIQVLRKRVSVKRKKPSELFDSLDWDNLQDMDNKGSKRSTDGVSDPLPKRTAVVSDTDEKVKKDEKEPSAESRQLRTPMIRLSRRYKKPRCRPTTLKEAMEANLYFAPHGFDLPSYTQLIIRMFEKYRRQLYVAQSKVKTRIPWGLPVVVGNRQGHTLDALLPSKTTPSIGMRSSAFVRGTLRGATSTAINNQSEQNTSDRRRTLRSSFNPVKQATVSTSTNKTTSATSTAPFKVDSDSEEDDCLMKSYLDEIARPSASTSTRKPATGWSKTRANSNREFGEARESRKSESPGEASVKTQTSSKDRVYEQKSDEPRKPVMNDQGVSFSANVVLDSDSSEIQSNTVDSLAQKLQNDSCKITKNSGMSQTKLDSETSASKGRVLPESKTTEDEVCLMDTEQENQAEVIQPPKRRSVLRPFEDDSTDDESDMSPRMFSLRFPGKESSVDCEMPSPRRENGAEIRTFADSEEDGGGVDVNNDRDTLASQSLTPQSESQQMFGKSILETMAAEGDELLPSQALSTESGEAFDKRVEETVEECNATMIASSSMNQGDERFVEQGLAVDEDASQRARRMRSERAAAAADRRQKQTTARRDVREACSSSSHDDFYMSQSKMENAEVEQQEESTVECPLCYQHFTVKEIEAHASDCQGPPPSPQASYCFQTQGEETGARSEPGPSFRSVPPARGTNQSSAVYRTLTGERGELKMLKVVLQRSPIAKQKLLPKATQDTDSAKRNLDFEKNSTRSGSLDRYRSSRSFDQGSRKPSRNTRAALRTESESDGSGYEKEKGESSSEVYSWLDAEKSPKKKKPHWTYGSSVKGNAPPILGGDYIPLNMSEKSDTEDSTTSKASKEHGHKQTSCKTEKEDSNSDSPGDSSTSDEELMLKYGAQRVSSRNKEPKRKKKEDETDENEIALALLGNRTKKRPLSLSKGSKAKKCRRPRSSDSDEDSDEQQIVCKLCNEKIPKELYEQHVNEELAERKRTGGVPRKVEVVTMKDTRQRSNKDELRRLSTREKPQKNIPCHSAATEDNDSDKQELDIDWDGVSNSPIKCFQFTENTNSVVDFQNQFEFLKQAKGGKRRSNYGQNDSSRGNRGGDRGSGARGGYRGSGSRGNYRGSYKKVYGRGKKYGKYRGSRGGK